MRRLLLALGIVSALACTRDSTGPGSDVVGVWDLTTVDGASLPFILVEEPDFRLEILADQMIADPNGTWAGTTDYRETEGGVTTITTLPQGGLWSQSGANVTINYFDGSSARATISGNMITFTGGRATAVYQRHY